MYQPGDILLVKDYPLPSGKKDKFFIVIEQSGSCFSLLAMTTSKQYIPDTAVKHGKIRYKTYEAYCFLAKKKISENGFSFHKNTFVTHSKNVHKMSADKLENFEVEVLGCLFDKEYQDLIYSYYKSNATQVNHKAIFETILDTIP